MIPTSQLTNIFQRGWNHQAVVVNSCSYGLMACHKHLWKYMVISWFTGNWISNIAMEKRWKIKPFIDDLHHFTSISKLMIVQSKVLTYVNLPSDHQLVEQWSSSKLSAHFPRIWTSPLKGVILDQICPWIFPPGGSQMACSCGRPGTWRTPCATWAAAERPWNSSGATSAKPWTAWMWRRWRRSGRWSRRSWWLHLGFEGVGWYFWRNLWIISYNIIILIELSIYELNYPLRSYRWLIYLWLIFWSCIWDILYW